MSRGGAKARRVRAQAQAERDPGAVRKREASPDAADLRRPAARRAAPPLRFPPRAERRARELGRAERRAARARPAAPRGARRGPSARLRGLRGRDPEGQLRRRARRDLGSGHVRARRGEAERRAHGPAARKAARGHLGARAGEALGRREELAHAPQARRGRAGQGVAAAVRADARDALGRSPRRGRLAPRGEVGRLSRARLSPRRRGRARQSERQRPDAALRERREGGREGGQDARLRPRRGDLRARRAWTLELLRDATGEARDAVRLLRLRPPRGGGRTDPGRAADEAEAAPRAPPRPAQPDGPPLGGLRRRRGFVSSCEGAAARGDRREASRLALSAGQAQPRLAEGEDARAAGVRHRGLHEGERAPSQELRVAHPRRLPRRRARLRRQLRHGLRRGRDRAPARQAPSTRAPGSALPRGAEDAARPEGGRRLGGAEARLRGRVLGVDA